MNKDNSNFYNQEFYESLENKIEESSKIIVSIILDNYKPKSILDIGCGNGVWLSYFEKLGVKEYIGIDGDYVTESFFRADYSKFIPKNLEIEQNINKKFDLALSLEVGEHLSTESSKAFVNTLCNHSDLIVFSAAIPGQKGNNHINEQWQSFWAKLFAQNNFYPNDEIRPKIWYKSKVLYWYRQNIIVYKKLTSNPIPTIEYENLDKIHPELKFRLGKKTFFLSQLFSSPIYVIKRSVDKYFNN